MRKLTKIIIPAVMAATALGAAGSASAQPYDHHFDHGRDQYDRAYGGHQAASNRAYAIRRQLDELQRRIDRNDRRDRISDRESFGLRRDIRSVREQFRWFNRDGLDNREFRTLQNRIDNIRRRLHIERSDRNDHRW